MIKSKQLLFISLTAICFILYWIYNSEPKDKNYKIQLKEWIGKEIILPDNMKFTIMGIDTIDFNFNKSKYKIVHYIDSIGCVSCKLKLPMWKEFINKMNSFQDSVSFIFIFQPKDIEELQYKLFCDNFNYPVYIDSDNQFNKINKLLTDDTFHTFLLNEKNHILSIGNPIENSSIKDLFLKIIQNKEITKTKNTKVQTDSTMYNFGQINIGQTYTCKFSITNIGKEPLEIKEIISSCECTMAEIDRESANPNEKINITITFREEKNKGSFLRTIDVFCNTEKDYITFTIEGNII